MCPRHQLERGAVALEPNWESQMNVCSYTSWDLGGCIDWTDWPELQSQGAAQTHTPLAARCDSEPALALMGIQPSPASCCKPAFPCCWSRGDGIQTWWGIQPTALTSWRDSTGTPGEWVRASAEGIQQCPGKGRAGVCQCWRYLLSAAQALVFGGGCQVNQLVVDWLSYIHWYPCLTNIPPVHPVIPSYVNFYPFWTHRPLICHSYLLYIHWYHL